MTNISSVFTLVHFRITLERLKINGAINAKYQDDMTPFSGNGIFTTYFSTYTEYYKGKMCYSLSVITPLSYKFGDGHNGSKENSASNAGNSMKHFYMFYFVTNEFNYIMNIIESLCT